MNDRRTLEAIIAVALVGTAAVGRLRKFVVGPGPAIEEPFDHVHVIKPRPIGSTLVRE